MTRLPVAPTLVTHDFDTLSAFPDFMTDVTVLPREVQLHQSNDNPYEDYNNFFLPEVQEEHEVDFEEEEELCL